MTENKADLVAMLKNRIMAFKRHKVYEVKTAASLDAIVERAAEIGELAAKLKAIDEQKKEG